MAFRDDYFRRILEQLEESAEERIAEDRRTDAPDTLERVDRALAERHRANPGLLHMTLDGAVLSGPKPISDRLDELYVVRTALCRHLEHSELEPDAVLLLIRSVLVGTEDLIARREEPGRPIDMLAGVLRQERMARLLSRPQIVETWRILFEIEARRGHWAQAEDYLFHAVRLSDGARPIIERGLDFYGELLDLSDRKIERGGLTRAEADRARWELLEILEAS